MKRILGRLTYANAMATVAVFIALGGASYAAIKLPKNSVGAKQLKKGAVTPAKLSKGSAAKLAGPKGATGATGAPGAPGKEGPPGKEGAQGPGAVAIEEVGSSDPQVIGVFAGVEVVDHCNTGGTAFLEFKETVGLNKMNEYGTVTEGTTVTVRQGENFSGQSVSGSVISTDLFLRDESATKAFSRFDFHMSGTSCKVWGVVTPSTLR